MLRYGIKHWIIYARCSHKGKTVLLKIHMEIRLDLANLMRLAYSIQMSSCESLADTYTRKEEHAIYSCR